MPTERNIEIFRLRFVEHLSYKEVGWGTSESGRYSANTSGFGGSSRYAAPMALSKKDRNDIFNLIQESGLDPADFDPPRDDEAGDTWLEHKPSRSMFLVGPESTPSGVFLRVSKKVGGDPANTFLLDENWLGEVESWLVEIERDLSTPDLWAEFARERDALSGTPHAPEDNTPFTADEQAEIATRLGDVAKYAAESGKYEDDELQVLNAKIDYLIESSKHSRRFDWREQAVGAFLSAVVGNVLPQGATMDVLNMIIGTVGHLIGHPVLGLPR